MAVNIYQVMEAIREAVIAASVGPEAAEASLKEVQHMIGLMWAQRFDDGWNVGFGMKGQG